MGIHLPVRSALLCVHPPHVGIYGGQRVEIREQPCGVGSLLTFTQVLPGCEAERLHPSVPTCEPRALHMLSKRSAAELRPHTQVSENPLVSGGGLENLTGRTSCDKNLREKGGRTAWAVTATVPTGSALRTCSRPGCCREWTWTALGPLQSRPSQPTPVPGTSSSDIGEIFFFLFVTVEILKKSQPFLTLSSLH